MATPTPAAIEKNFMVYDTGAAIGTGPGNVRSLCDYRTNDSQAEVETAGYFNPLFEAGLIKLGDVIKVSYDEDGTPGLTEYLVTTAVAGSDVEITQTDLA